ncbi:hypothetical protein DO97_18350 [Neosynechococcus sphagnicola sy1]|uniref:STAS domain-containing protein n=1 Tax=Neosynechococcus sphagnicola sy1 TaxID=1497020 RepID=A0A098TRP6_9CYAN|nr:STAS domain-containing protein [Neosynechococcus sphagnicola]KGF73478.1 hypothetical protein DO97_18350 [Neosynechococcus sphagnicola sy1]
MLISTEIRVIQPTGFLSTANSAAFLEDFKRCFEADASIILVDLQEITFLDSSGLGTLIHMHTKLRLAGRRLCLCSLNEQALTLLEISDLDRVLEIFENQDAFFDEIVK